jgi:hypothetical protein
MAFKAKAFMRFALDLGRGDAEISDFGGRRASRGHAVITRDSADAR